MDRMSYNYFLCFENLQNLFYVFVWMIVVFQGSVTVYYHSYILLKEMTREMKKYFSNKITIFFVASGFDEWEKPVYYM